MKTLEIPPGVRRPPVVIVEEETLIIRCIAEEAVREVVAIIAFDDQGKFWSCFIESLVTRFVFLYRSLQLSERSPNRQAHKVVVRVGNVPKNQPIYAQVRKPGGYRSSSNNPDYARPSQIRLEIEGKKPRSFDVIDYERPIDYEQEFDKSKSFDDEYYNNYDRLTFHNDQRSYSHDRVYAQIDFNSLPRSENVNYGYAPGATDMSAYDVPKMRAPRSPLMNYQGSGRNINRERSPQYQRSSPYAHVSQQQQEMYRRSADVYRGRSDQMYLSPSSPNSDYDRNNGHDYSVIDYDAKSGSSGYRNSANGTSSSAAGRY